MVKILEDNNVNCSDELQFAVTDDVFSTGNVYEITMTELISLFDEMMCQMSADGGFAIPIYLEERMRKNQTKRRINPSRKSHMVR